MAIAVLNSLADGIDVTATGASLITVPTYNPSGLNIGVVVFFSGVGTATMSASNPRRNTVAGTAIAAYTVHSSTYYSGCYYWEDTDATGDHVITVNFTSTQTNTTMGAMYVENADVTGGMIKSSTRQLNTWGGGTITLPLTSDAGGMVLDTVFWQDADSTITVGANQTKQWDHNGYQNAWDVGYGSWEAGTGGTITMSWEDIASTSFDAHIVVSLVPASVTTEQEGFRFFKDDGSESAATGEAAQDVNITVGKGVRKRLRINRNFSGDPATETVALQYKKSGDGDAEYRDVPLT